LKNDPEAADAAGECEGRPQAVTMTTQKQNKKLQSLVKTMKLAASEQIKTQVLATDARLFAESVVDTIREPLLVLGADLGIVRANRAFYQTFKIRPEETEGFLLFELNNGEWNIPMLRRLFAEIQKNRKSFDNYEIEHDFSGLGRRSMLLNARPLFSETGETELIVLAMEDVTDRKHVEQMLRELSLTDELTRLYNRRGFLTLAEDRLRSARRTKTGLWMFFADVDGLKHINDSFGHQEGDRALMEIASILKKGFRESDIIARLSGDEFIILISTTFAADDCENIVLTRVQKSICDLNLQGARMYKLALSMGACHFAGTDQWTVENMMVKADERLYELKNSRKSENIQGTAELE